MAFFSHKAFLVLHIHWLSYKMLLFVAHKYKKKIIGVNQTMNKEWKTFITSTDIYNTEF